ncbi:siphovirus Gp157 family protein [Methylibium sp.]|uniref:siphovirus Gp157 family protein n=1 Tax=Methylibium sp. TaxID=2067992 RepID=UPI0017F0B0D7|nr:siphovirus Gp157 family protein [Methylibium sp.]MBA3589682.1 siphovirus Gp157 family protein [Methylibium sp.]
MTALFVIAQEYRAAAETLADLDLDDQTIADTLEGMAGDLEVKSEAVALFVHGLDAMAQAVKAREGELRQRRDSIERRAESLREYLSRTLKACGISKIERPGVVIGFRKSSAVVINEPGLIPVEYMRQPEMPPPSADKKAIADAIKAGKDVPGAHIEERKSLSIK